MNGVRRKSRARVLDSVNIGQFEPVTFIQREWAALISVAVLKTDCAVHEDRYSTGFSGCVFLEKE